MMLGVKVAVGAGVAWWLLGVLNPLGDSVAGCLDGAIAAASGSGVPAHCTHATTQAEALPETFGGALRDVGLLR